MLTVHCSVWTSGCECTQMHIIFIRIPEDVVNTFSAFQ